jgi:apolipoprotein N-acyltransferase
LAFAALYVLAEEVRAGPLLLPWVLSGQAMAASPLWIQVADLGGVPAVSFSVVSISAGVGLAVSRRSLAPLLLPAVLAVAVLGYGAFRLQATDATAPTLSVGVVQGSVLPKDRFLPGSAGRHVSQLLEASESLVAAGPIDLVVWAETAIDGYVEREPALARSLQDFVERSAVALVTGAPREPAPRVFTNSVLLYAPGQTSPEVYDKQQLVPFTEYNPELGWLLGPLLSGIERGEPFTPGAEATVFQAGPVPLAAPVCFEITYASQVRQFQSGGAALILNLSNDAWFGRTGFAEMHLAQAVFRAVELRTSVVRAANTGISALIDSRGRIQSSLGVFQAGTLRGEVALASSTPSFYARFGGGPVLVLLVAVLAGSMLAGRRRARSEAP